MFDFWIYFYNYKISGEGGVDGGNERGIREKIIVLRGGSDHIMPFNHLMHF